MIESGIIYVAPPDHHMLLTEPGKIQLSHGPKENHTRPRKVRNSNPFETTRFGSSITAGLRPTLRTNLFAS